MVRKLDCLGRVVLPTEFRQALQIRENDDVEVTLKSNEIILKKAVASCFFCGSDEDLTKVRRLAPLPFLPEKDKIRNPIQQNILLDEVSFASAITNLLCNNTNDPLFFLYKFHGARLHFATQIHQDLFRLSPHPL